MNANATQKSSTYSNLRGKLLLKGTNIKRWAELNCLPVSTVYGAAKGERFGIKAANILKKLKAYANE
jgi:hypothetical protein